MGRALAKVEEPKGVYLPKSRNAVLEVEIEEGGAKTLKDVILLVAATREPCVWLVASPSLPGDSSIEVDNPQIAEMR